jgi:repressor LexA
MASSKSAQSEPRPLTPRQYAALRAIEWYKAHHGNDVPTQAELSKMLKMRSKQGSRALLDALEKRGWIRRQKNKWRSIQVLHPSSRAKVVRPVR